MLLPHATVLIYLRMKGIFQEAIQTFLQHPNRMCNQGQPHGVAEFSGLLESTAASPTVGQEATMLGLFLSFKDLLCVCVCVCMCVVAGRGVKSRQYKVDGHEVNKTYRSFRWHRVSMTSKISLL